MTRTEERLQDALHASAGRVRDDRLRPLPDVVPVAERETGPQSVWRGWLVPAAAAVSVALIIGLAVAVTGHAWRPASGPPADSSRTAVGFPKYFADFTGSDPPGFTMQVRSTSTGAVVASAPFPKVPGWSLILNTVAASPDGSTFYVDYDASHVLKSSLLEQIWIYRLTITSSGLVIPLTRIKGEIPGAAALGLGGSMAVSPDGTKLALTADTTERLGNNTPGWADKIVVIDLRTGAYRLWQGGLYRSGKTFTIPDISWTADGRSLVFLALWCDFPPATSSCGGTPSPQEYRDTQIRSLSLGTGGGALDRSALLLSQSARYPVIVRAIAGPDAAELTMVVLSGQADSFGSWSKVAVERVSAVNGSLLAVEYSSGALGRQRPGGAAISADPSGRYLLFTYRDQPGRSHTTWIDHGKLRFLPLKHPNPELVISAW